MPNETSNILQIYGEQNDITTYLKDHFCYGPNHCDDYKEIIWNFEHSVPITNQKYINAEKELEKDNLDSNTHNNLIAIKNEYTEKYWGTHRGMVTYHKDNKIHIDTPWTSCIIWFKNMISKYPKLNFSLKYNDEFREEFYGWAVAYKGILIDSEKICLHPSEEGGINIFKYYNKENGYDAESNEENE